MGKLESRLEMLVKIRQAALILVGIKLLRFGFRLRVQFRFDKMEIGKIHCQTNTSRRNKNLKKWKIFLVTSSERKIRRGTKEDEVFRRKIGVLGRFGLSWFVLSHTIDHTNQTP